MFKNNLKFGLVGRSRLSFCEHIETICLYWINNGFRRIGSKSPIVTENYIDL